MTGEHRCDTYCSPRGGERRSNSPGELWSNQASKQSRVTDIIADSSRVPFETPETLAIIEKNREDPNGPL
jgi:hypothetical protein